MRESGRNNLDLFSNYRNHCFIHVKVLIMFVPQFIIEFQIIEKKMMLKGMFYINLSLPVIF